jgi:hypothetical protein
MLQEYAGIPGGRASCDSTVHAKRALALMQCLRSVCSVLLNGRAPGDAAGACAYYALNAVGHTTGQSVIDLGFVSARLFAQLEVHCSWAGRPELGWLGLSVYAGFALVLLQTWRVGPSGVHAYMPGLGRTTTWKILNAFCWVALHMTTCVMPTLTPHMARRTA